MEKLKKEILLSKLEYTKKKQVTDRTEKGLYLDDILNKINEGLSLEQKDKLVLLASLEYTFKKAFINHKELGILLPGSNMKEQAINILLDLGM